MIERMSRMSFFFYIVATAWQDGRKKAVSGWLLLFFFVHFLTSQICRLVFDVDMEKRLTAIWYQGMCADPSLLPLWAGCLIGVVLLIVSKVTEGALGEGDGLFFFIAGIYLGFWKNLFLLCSSLFFCSIAGLVYMVLGRLKGKDYRKRKLPLLVFALPAGMWLACC